MIFLKIYKFLSSVKLAIALLVLILVCCLVGVTVLQPQVARILIFSSLWFNALLVLLVVNVGFCFFGRIWRRKLTIISTGMILFHLSFVSIFAGIISNSLFYFYGSMRLAEGETLPNNDPQSYDDTEWGRFFDHAKLKGETTLIKLHTHYRAGGDDKGIANEVSIGEGSTKTLGMVYVTNNLNYRGFRYFRDRDGFSILIILSDKQGRELYGAFVPLQSLKQKDDKTYLYTTGTAAGPGGFAYPQDAQIKPLFDLRVQYVPDPKIERTGHVSFQVRPYETGHNGKEGGKIIAEGKVPVGEKFDAGNFNLEVREVRYWASMNVLHDPGQPIVLTSLWVGLGGMLITFIGRMRRSRT